MKLSINQLKYLKSLHQRKFRQKYHNFIVEGAKMAGETLRNGQLAIESVYAGQEWLDANQPLLAGISSPVVAVSKDELKKISLLPAPQQVLLVVEQPNWQLDASAAASGLSLFLENIQDPGNLGTILRVADWFGIPRVFLSEDCVEVFNPKVVQASMGAFLRVACFEINFHSLLGKLPSIPVYGAMLHGEDVFKMPLPDHGLIVIGNESKGISPAIEKALTHKITISRPAGGHAESLNAAVAAGIICAAFRNK